MSTCWSHNGEAIIVFKCPQEEREIRVTSSDGKSFQLTQFRKDAGTVTFNFDRLLNSGARMDASTLYSTVLWGGSH